MPCVRNRRPSGLRQRCAIVLWDGTGSQDFHPENARDGMKPQREAFHYASFCSILLWDITRVRGSGRRNWHWLYGA